MQHIHKPAIRILSKRGPAYALYIIGINSVLPAKQIIPFNVRYDLRKIRMIPRKNGYPARHGAGVVKNRKAGCASPKGLSCSISPSLSKTLGLTFAHIICTYTLHSQFQPPSHNFTRFTLPIRPAARQPNRFKTHPKRHPVNIVLSSYFIACSFAYYLPFVAIFYTFSAV